MPDGDPLERTRAGGAVAAQLTERMGKQFSVDNRAGAGGTLGTEIVLNAAPDGYTLLVVSMAHAVNPWLYKLKYDMTKAAKGFLSTVTSGEGLVFKYTGPGEIYLQSRNLKGLVDVISPLLPKPTSGFGG
jgi:hypothetical protein